MANRLPTKPNDGPAAEHVRAELAQILASDLFARSERLSSFLRFIVERTLAGQGDSLKEQVIATELYGKDADFNTAADPIVRVDARRLRDRLREYYDVAPAGGVVISVPKGSYTPLFLAGAANPTRTAHIAPVETPVSRRWLFALPIVVAIGVFFAAAAISLTNDRREPGRLLTATSLPGAEEDPALSPDASFVAFSWAPSPGADTDIWIKSVDGEAMRNVTNTPGVSEKWPRWSPDGQWITFSRLLDGRPAVLKVSVLGGPEQMIAESSRDATWTPDGRALVMDSVTREGRHALVHHLLESGERRQLTVAPLGFSEAHPRVSPDGRTVAFQRGEPWRSAVFLVPISGGEPALLGDWTSGIIGGVEWMPDGREILVSWPAPSGRRLMRVAVGSRGEGTPVPGIPYDSVGPSISRVGTGRRYRLAVMSGQVDVGLRLVDLEGPRQGATIVADSPFCDATRMDMPGRFSPDGRQVAFTSDRSGSPQIWVANRDGSALRAVTQLQDTSVSLGSWSPDGQRLAFDAATGAAKEIYVVPVGGGPVKRFTEGLANATDPEWSRDGQWFYFSSNQSGSSTIWKMPVTGGAPLQLTSETGFDPHESPDGRAVYFVDRPRLFGLHRGAKLKRVAVAGGRAETLDVSVIPGAWDVTDSGVVFLSEKTVQIYDFKDHRTRTIGELGFVVGPSGSSRFLTVSRDGRWALASHVDRVDRDIMVLNDFR